jgi:cyclopropane fatty-acyl-phospholipid synthase-like methyltransferase
MRDFYESFYLRTAQSAAHAEFCSRVFGRNLCQHGFADMNQLHALIEGLSLAAGHQVLDLGSGIGMIAEYIAGCTGACVTGLDYIPLAVQLANQRTASKRDRLSFVVGDIQALQLLPASFDAIVSIDSIYFSDDYTHTIAQLAAALRPGGRMGFLYSFGREPWIPPDQFPADRLEPSQTPLAQALNANHFVFTSRDFTSEDHRLALLRKAVLHELRPSFERDDLMFVYNNRMGDAEGVCKAIEEGLHRRYLYLAQRADA